MTINIIGNTYPVERLVTGLYSFDHAFINQKGEIGFPLGKGTEIYGANHIGKSTLAYSLAGIISKGTEDGIALVDLEGFDPSFLSDVLESVGYSGDVKVIGGEDDEEMLGNLIVDLQKGYDVGILDSVGTISPIEEQVEELGAANMGRRGRLMAQFTRKAVKVLREHPNKNIFLINHEYPNIGTRGKSTPGGEVKKYIASMRISLKRIYRKSGYEEYPDGSYRIHGTVVKNRWGIKGREFQLVILSGSGIHFGLTAMFDAIDLGLVDRRRTIKIGKESFGYLRDIFPEAHNKNDEFFQPFIELLENNKDGTQNTSTEHEDIQESKLDNNEDDD